MLKRYLPCVIAIAAILAPISAQADAVGVVGQKLTALWNFLGSPEPETGTPSPLDAAPIARIAPTPLASPTLTAPSLADMRAPEIPVAAALPTPSVETPLHRLFCVEYARARSGMAVFGDAKFWWDHAKNLYGRMASPVQEAVMVFSGSKRLKRGHVAVVTDIVSAREIRVDQANWLNKGEIDHATPVLDVSAGNDWSQVRVWDVRSRTFGSHVYAISGFIVKSLTRQASND